MKYQLSVHCPSDEGVIDKIIEAASAAGAGSIGNYSHCAFVIRGSSQWKSEKGARPSVGNVGQVSKVNGAKIEMRCPAEKRVAVEQAIRRVHPYEEPDIQCIKLAE